MIASANRWTSRSDLGLLFHRLNNQLGIILANAELLETKASDEMGRARAAQVVASVLDAMTTAREIRLRSPPLNRNQAVRSPGAATQVPLPPQYPKFKLSPQSAPRSERFRSLVWLGPQSRQIVKITTRRVAKGQIFDDSGRLPKTDLSRRCTWAHASNCSFTWHLAAPTQLRSRRCLASGTAVALGLGQQKETHAASASRCLSA